MLFNDYDIRGVVNLAVEIYADNSIKIPETFVNTNVVSTLTLIVVAYKHWMTGRNNVK